MHRRLALALACALLLTPVGGRIAWADALEQVMESKKLRVAVPQDFPPFGSVGLDLQPLGYDVDMAQLLAAKMGVELELVPVTSANRIPYLTTGKVDLIISSLGKNPDREKVIDFSTAYAPFYNGVFGPAEIAVGKPEDLKGKTLGVTRGSVEDLELSKLVPAEAVIKR
jgi:polar amino acid transport system substrate-binding protein